MAQVPITIHIETPEQLDRLVNAAVDSRLAALGGEMLALHGPGTEHENPVLATMGGYLLQAFGQRAADSITEAPAPDGQ